MIVGVSGRGTKRLMFFYVWEDSAIEVLRKVSDPEFVRRLKSLGLVERVYVEFRKAEAGEGDRVRTPSSFPLIFLSF